MKYEITTPPVGRPVTWEQAQAHIRDVPDSEQAAVELMVDAAVDFAEDAIGGSLMSRTITATFYEGERIQLPRGPALNILSVNDAIGLLGTSKYHLERHGSSDRLTIRTAFTYPVTVVYRAGYPTADAIPASIRQGILVHAATLYENRESVADRTKTPVPHSLADFYRLKSRNCGVG